MVTLIFFLIPVAARFPIHHNCKDSAKTVHGSLYRTQRMWEAQNQTQMQKLHLPIKWKTYTQQGNAKREKKSLASQNKTEKFPLH